MDINFTVNKIYIYACCVKISDPVVTSFGSMPSRRTVFICIEDHDGICGWGEIWGNFPIVTADYRAKLAAWVLPQYLLNAEIEHPRRFTTQLEKRLNSYAYRLGKLDQSILSLLLLIRLFGIFGLIEQSFHFDCY